MHGADPYDRRIIDIIFIQTRDRANSQQYQLCEEVNDPLYYLEYMGNANKIDKEEKSSINILILRDGLKVVAVIINGKINRIFIQKRTFTKMKKR